MTSVDSDGKLLQVFNKSAEFCVNDVQINS